MPRSDIKRRGIAVIVLALVTFILFSNSLNNSFIWDDEKLIVQNKFIRSLKHIPLLFTVRYKDYHHLAKGQYRPVRTVTFSLDHFLWKTEPFGYHLTNVLLHVLNVILVYFLLYGLAGPESRKSARFLSLPFVTALLFATHPIHTESVNWVKNRSDLLALLFFLVSFLLFIKRTPHTSREKNLNVFFYGASLLAFVLSLLSKEMALGFLSLSCSISCVFRRRTNTGRDCLPPSRFSP